MNIPKSYEALAADLASEKIISKTLQGQKDSYMMLADGRKFDLDAIQQRLTVAERRLSQVECACDLVMSAIDDDERGANFVKIIQAIKEKAALKPAAKPHKCIECDNQYCHGVCVERGDDDECYKGAEGEGS